MNFNKVFLMGNLTRDVELRHTPANMAVGSFGLAINRKYQTSDGERKEETTFVDCEAWGKAAETMAQYLSKGRPVFVEGRLKLDQWEDRNDGSKRSKIKVVVEQFQFIDSKPGGQGGGKSSDRTPRSGQANAQSRQRSYDDAPAIADDDIPF